MSAVLGFSLLVFVALIHTVLGERTILRPLFAARWDVGISRFAAERILRFAWHLTSIAWIGLAAILLDLPPTLAIGIVCLLSGAVGFAGLRGHPAWPLFLLAGGFALAAGGFFPSGVAVTLALVAAAVAVAVAGLHLYWVAGGRVGLANAVPQHPDGSPKFKPGPVATAAVALACAGFAALIIWRTFVGAPLWVDIALGVSAVAFTARAVGDGRSVGFTKRKRATPFEKSDDALFTPLVVVLLLGTLSAFAVSHG